MSKSYINALASPLSVAVIFLYIMTVGALFLFLPDVFTNLFYFWREISTYEHVIVVFPMHVILLLALLLRLQTENVQVRPSWVGLVLVLLCSFFSIAANKLSIQSAEMLMLPFYIFCSFLAVFGWAVAWRLAPAIFYLIFVIPMWELAVPYLQLLIVTIMSMILEFVGIASYIQGNFVSIPQGTFEIASGCSGLKYLITQLAICSFYSVLYVKEFRYKMSLIIAGVLLALLANWIRVLSLILIGHFTDMKSSLMHDHETFGWVIFGLSLIPLGFIFGKVPQRESDDQIVYNKVEIKPYIGLMAILVISVMSLPKLVSVMKVDGQIQHNRELPMLVGDWKNVTVRAEQNQSYAPLLKGYSSKISGRYTNGMHHIDVFISKHNSNSQGEELIQEDNYIYNPDIWQEKAGTRISEATFEELELRSQRGESRMIRYAYLVDQEIVKSSLMLKLILLKKGLLGSGMAELVVISSECLGACDSLYPTLDEFEAALVYELNQSTGNGV